MRDGPPFVRRFFGAGRTTVFWCGTDHLPEIDPAGLPFLGSPPPTLRNQKIGTANDQRTEKRMLIFRLNC